MFEDDYQSLILVLYGVYCANIVEIITPILKSNYYNHSNYIGTIINYS
jgi:hypothetical protein